MRIMVIFAIALLSMSWASASSSSTGFSAKYAMCIEKAGLADHLILDCVIDEYQRQDALLNNIYKQLLSRVPSEKRERLKTLQRKWISYRDESCDLLGDFVGTEGSLAKREPMECQARLTAERVAELKKLAAYASE